MAPRSQLSIATSSLQRLVKEEASYHKELEQQKARIEKLEQSGGDENADFQLRQERKALEETKAVIPSMKQRIGDTLAQLERQLEANKDSDPAAKEDEITKAKEAVAQAKTAMGEVASAR